MLGAQGAVAVALRHVFAGTAALLVAAIPLWVAVFRAVAGDRPARAAAARLLLGFTGVTVVLVAGSGAGGGWSAWSLLVVAATAGWAGGTHWASRTGSLPAPRAATVLQLVTGGLVLLALGGVLEAPGFKITVGAAGWIAPAYLVIVDSLAGFMLYNRLLRTTDVTVVSTYAYAVPVVACLVGVLVLHEPFRPPVALGAVVIVIAVAAEIRAAR
ncbi:EamA family transporter [Amycolatopsis sp. NBC_00345]|uniref:EamA family transporter n=1 Tax=Amycolatopsis sp. NBC_00345 TaxID=2975955 RepID=UPI002E267D45